MRLLATLSLRATGAWIYDRDPFVPIQVRFVIVIALGLCGAKTGRIWRMGGRMRFWRRRRFNKTLNPVGVGVP